MTGVAPSTAPPQPLPGAGEDALSEKVNGLPPSARTVFETLARDGPLTHKDLLAATGMPGRTVRYAVSRLKDAGVIDARCNLMDCRQCYFFVSGQCPGTSTKWVRGPGSRAM